MSKGLLKVSRIAGHFPPSSRVTGVKCLAAADITMLPTRGLPENIEMKKKKIVILIINYGIAR